MESERPPMSASAEIANSDRATAWERALTQSAIRDVVALPSFAHMLDDTDQG
jgi:hypothetical protein